MWSVAWNPAGTRIVSGSHDNTLCIWSGTSFYKDGPRRARKDLDLSRRTSICREVARAWQAGDVSLAWRTLEAMCEAAWVSELLDALNVNGHADGETPEQTGKARDRSRDIRAAIGRHLAQEQEADPEAPPPFEDSVKALHELIEIDAGDRAIAWLVDSACKLVESRDDSNRPLRVALLGEFSSGKSRLINALLGEKVLSVGRVPVTRSVTRLVHADELSITVRHADGSEVGVAPDDLRAHTDERRREEGAPEVEEVVVGHPSPLLASVEVIDTPGFNSDNELHDQVAAQLLLEADAVLWILAPHQVGSRSEARLLDTVGRAQGKVVVVLNQIDTLEGPEAVECQVAAAHEHYEGNVVNVIATSAKWLEQEGEHPGGELKFANGVVADGAGANREALMATIARIGTWNEERRERRLARRAAATAAQARAYLQLKAAEEKAHATYMGKVQQSRAKQRKQALDLWKEALQHRDEVHQVRGDAQDRWFKSHCAHRRPLADAYETLWKGDLDRAEADQLLSCLHTLEELHWHLSPHDPTPWREDLLLSAAKGMVSSVAVSRPDTLVIDTATSGGGGLKELLVSLLEQDPHSGHVGAEAVLHSNPHGEARHTATITRGARRSDRSFWSRTGGPAISPHLRQEESPPVRKTPMVDPLYCQTSPVSTSPELSWLTARWAGMGRSCEDNKTVKKAKAGIEAVAVKEGKARLGAARVALKAARLGVAYREAEAGIEAVRVARPGIGRSVLEELRGTSQDAAEQEKRAAELLKQAAKLEKREKYEQALRELKQAAKLDDTHEQKARDAQERYGPLILVRDGARKLREAQAESESARNLQRKLRGVRAAVLGTVAIVALYGAGRWTERSMDASTHESIEEQRQRYNAAIEGVIGQVITAGASADAETLQELLEEASNPTNREKLTQLLENIEIDPTAAGKAIAKQILQAVEYERACDLWQLSFTSNTTATLSKGTDELDSLAFHAIKTPPDELVRFTIEAIRRSRDTSNRPVVLWIEYSGSEEMKRVTRSFFNSAREKILSDIRNELIGQNVIIADQL